jgi:phosphopantothenoylcysteine decarboxylase
MANILLGVTGSVAAVRTPTLYEELKKAGYAVKVVATQAALYFFDAASLDPIDRSRPRRNPDVVILDEDEWPGRAEGKRYRRDDPVLHIELRRWADLLLIAPLDANTLAKLANGLADNCLTCVWRAWDANRTVVLVPAMNTLMWEHPLTTRHLCQIAADGGAGAVAANLDLGGVVSWVNQGCAALHVLPPQSKRLACGDVGVGAMAEVSEIVAIVHSMIQRRQSHPKSSTVSIEPNSD